MEGTPLGLVRLGRSLTDMEIVRLKASADVIATSAETTAELKQIKSIANVRLEGADENTFQATRKRIIIDPTQPKAITPFAYMTEDGQIAFSDTIKDERQGTPKVQVQEETASQSESSMTQPSEASPSEHSTLQITQETKSTKEAQTSILREMKAKYFQIEETPEVVRASMAVSSPCL
jgi:hypothetical protein